VNIFLLQIYFYAETKFFPVQTQTNFDILASAGVSFLKVSEQIIGGSKAALKQFPWQIYLDVDDAWLCGGSMILADWAMTAAHCVYGLVLN